VLDQLGLPPVASQGRALFGEGAERGSQAVYAEKRNGSDAMRAWITPDGKLIETKPPGPEGEKPPISGVGRWQFYRDPVGPEQHDALDALPPEEFAARRALLEETWAHSVRLFAERAGDGETRRVLRDDEIEALRALGYVEESPGPAPTAE
jgi:hypothetical protein